MDTRTSPFRLGIERLRDTCAAHGVHAVLVPSSDPHLSEYLPGHWQGREWLSGFTGSMATLVVTRDTAALFADSRYWTQAQAQLAGSCIELVKIPTGNSSAHVEWLAAKLLPGSVVACDGQVLGLSARRACPTSQQPLAVDRSNLDRVAVTVSMPAAADVRQWATGDSRRRRDERDSIC